MKKILLVLFFIICQIASLSYAKSFLQEGIAWARGEVLFKDMNKNEIIINDTFSHLKRTLILSGNNCELVKEGDKVSVTYEVNTNKVRLFKIINDKQ